MVMCTYNREHMLAEAAAAVLAQQDVDLELIVVDNGSGPATADLLGRIGDPRLRVVRNDTPLGGTRGRNTGLAAARGRHVAFCDDDDLWAPGKLRAQLSAHERTGRRWSYTGCVFIDAAGRLLGGRPPLPPDVVAAMLPTDYPIPGGISSMLWERDALDGFLDDRLTLSTDWDLALRLLRNAGLPAIVSEPLVAYRQHGANLSRTASTHVAELDVVERKHADLLAGRRVDRAARYRFFGSEAARVGGRMSALRFYGTAFRLGDAGALPRAAAALLPRSAQPRLRRRLLSDAAWLARANEWLAARPRIIWGTRRPRVVIVQNTVRRYRTAFYEDLRRRLAERGVALEVLHSNDNYPHDARSDLATLPWTQSVAARSVLLRGHRVTWQAVLRRTRGADLVIVEQATQHVVNPLLVAGQYLGGPRVAFWGHGRDHAIPEGTGLAQRTKRVLSRRAHWWFAYTEGAADVVERLGFPRSRTTVVQNATDSRTLAHMVRMLPAEAVEELRMQLGVGQGPVGVFIGSMGPQKRLPFLVEALDRLHARIPGFSFVFAGRGRMHQEVDAVAASRAWVHRLGTVHGPDLARVLALADVMLMPGWLGLAVVDAFAAGVPVVTSASGLHPPEVEYLRDGVNGLLVDDGGDVKRYVTAVVELLDDPVRLKQLRSGALESAEQLSAEEMARRFGDGITRALIWS